MEYQQKLGNRIRKIRELANIKQSYMAEKLSISQQQYSALEKGETKVSTERLEKIAELLNVTPEKISKFDEETLLRGIENNSFHSSTGNIINHINESHNKEIKELYETRISEIHKMYKEQITELHAFYQSQMKK